AVMFARSEGIVPAPESSHAIRAAIDEAVKAKEAGEEKVILFNLSGHGYFDKSSYDLYFSGNMKDVEYSRENVEKSIARLPKVK
ncbi:MAG TPA: TrpB-like pyridoxal-phosphate dependent enzyme, partial [Clostridiales bacterium]|nr:TrpB-like pyridoxal-phosphate dependent enzyme [Clostridiales bacterium]